jgi:N-acetyl-anhydromuramyl-L-alanine amidase AmpD
VPPGGFSKRWTCIVVHHSATSCGCASEFHHAHQARGWDELGYHFVIGNGTGSANGQIEVGPRWYKQKHGAHCKTAGNYHNEHGIGICLVGNFERTRPTARQMASLNKLLRFLMANCGIPANRVIGHREAPGAQTVCPGANVIMARIRATARNLLAQSR